jgi:hypothetical protein
MFYHFVMVDHLTSMSYMITSIGVVVRAACFKPVSLLPNNVASNCMTSRQNL